MDYSDRSIEKSSNRSCFLTVQESLATLEVNFLSKKSKRLFDWWSSFHPAKPDKDAFDIINHIKDASGYFLYKILAKDNYEVRLIGEDASNIIGYPYSRILINEETAKSDAHLASLLVYLSKICEEKTAYTCVGTYSDTLGHVHKFQSLDCPLVNSDGEVDEIIGVLEDID